MEWEDIVKRARSYEHEEQIKNIIQMLEELRANMDEDGDYSDRQLRAVSEAIRRLEDV
tara:strand:+ start:796 stop:969 length:174 start_codon:yes stop_codon:yes gene_type:complete